MLGMMLALAIGDWHAPESRSRDYAVVAMEHGAIVRRISAETTYSGPYGDRGYAVGVVAVAPFRGRRIVVESSVATTGGSGDADAFVAVWGREGLLTGDDSNAHRQRFGSQPSRCTFVLDVPADAESIEVGVSLSGTGEASIGDARVDLAPPETAPTGRPLVAPISAETRSRVATALRGIAVLFDRPGTAALAAVARATTHARIIGLGETAHGSAAEDARAADVFRFLATHDDVRVLAIEGMYGTTRHLDAYVGGAAEDVDERLRETNFYAFQTREFRRLLDWMRAQNARRPAARRLHVVGVDMQYVTSQRAFVLDRLSAVDRAAAAEATRRYACTAQSTDVAACLREVRAVTRLVQLTFGARAGIDEAHAARMVEQYMEQYAGDPSSRDHAIAENIAWAADTRFPGSRVVVWAQFFHLGVACCLGHATAAGDLAKRYGDRYYALGLVFGEGTVRAIPAGERTPREVTAPPASANTLEAVLDDVGPDYFVNLAAPQLDEFARAWLALPHRLRRVTLFTDAFRPETDWTDERLSDALDGFIYLRSTTAPEPIANARTAM